MNYQEAVTEFRHLDDSIEAGQWRQAQIVWEQVKAGSSRLSLARDTGKSASHINVLFRVWDSRSAVNAPVTFAEAYRMADRNVDTPEEASALNDANRAASALGKLPAKSRAQIIREHFTDPDVLNEVMRDPAARSHATEAIDRQRTERDRREHEEFAQDRPGPVADPFEVLVKFRYLRRTLEEIAGLLARRGGVVSPEARDALLEEITWLGNALDMIREGVRGGDVDAAIAHILSEAGGPS